MTHDPLASRGHRSSERHRGSCPSKTDAQGERGPNQSTSGANRMYPAGDSAGVLPDTAEVIANDGRPIAVTVRLVQGRVRVTQNFEVALVRIGQVRVGV